MCPSCVSGSLPPRKMSPFPPSTLPTRLGSALPHQPSPPHLDQEDPRPPGPHHPCIPLASPLLIKPCPPSSDSRKRGPFKLGCPSLRILPPAFRSTGMRVQNIPGREHSGPAPSLNSRRCGPCMCTLVPGAWPRAASVRTERAAVHPLEVGGRPLHHLGMHPPAPARQKH